AAGQDERPLERAVAALVAMHPFGPLLGLLLLLAANGQDVVLQRDLHVLRGYAGDLGDNLDRVLVLEDIARRIPGRRHRTALLGERAERLLQNVGRAPKALPRLRGPPGRHEPRSPPLRQGSTSLWPVALPACGHSQSSARAEAFGQFDR